MGAPKLEYSHALITRRTHHGFEEWNNYTTGGLWTTTTAGSGSATAAGQFGILTLAAVDSTLNREVYVATTNNLFQIVSGKTLMAECYLQYSEANTNKANIAFGFMNSVGAASMADTTGEPKSSFSGAVIYKVPGGTAWKTCSSVGTTQTVNTSTTTAGGSSYVRLKIEIEPVSTTIAEVTYWVNDVQLQTTGGRPGQSLIKDQLTYTGDVAMQLFHCLKNGSTTPETLLVDYTAWEQGRVQWAA